MEKKETINEWFGLTYASYLVIPRSILQSMPEEWQHDFTELLNELPKALGDWEGDVRFKVSTRDNKGKFVKYELQQYRHNKLPINKEYKYKGLK